MSKIMNINFIILSIISKKYFCGSIYIYCYHYLKYFISLLSFFKKKFFILKNNFISILSFYPFIHLLLKIYFTQKLLF